MRLDKRFPVVVLVLLSAVLLSSCKSNHRSGASRATGWKYNDENYGGFEVVEGYKPETAPGLKFIEGGTFIMGRTEQDVVYDWNNVPRRVTVSSFYIDETECTNVEYREYLFWVRRVYGDKLIDVYDKALPDTLVWRSPMAFNEPFVRNYFRHPAYNDHPVVGVSWRQVVDYAHWRTNRVNEWMLDKRGILTIDADYVQGQQAENNFDTEAYLLGRHTPANHKGLPSKQPGASQTGRNATIEDGIMFSEYRLPTEAEWEYAASGLLGNTVQENVAERKIYPWNGHNVRNRNNIKNELGQMQANFVRGKGNYMGTAGDLNDRGDITRPVDSYWPNDFGLYCMAGNVNEWVLDVYRPLSSEDVDELRPYRGNVFEAYDTELGANNRPTIKNVDQYGRIQKHTDTAFAGRRNYDRAYYINYRDGDKESTMQYNEGNTIDQVESTNNMYYQGVDDGKLKHVGMTTQINDQARVYKGGGWRDRAYWLSPGARRFLDENSSTCDIGFRLAMDAVGEPAEVDRR